MIEIRGLSYAPRDDRDHWSLNIDRLSIDSGERVAIMGPSGSGKSTLLGLMSGLHRPHRGELMINQTALHTLSSAERARWRSRSVSWQSELTTYRGALSQRELIDLEWWLGLSQRSDQAQVEAALHKLGLSTVLGSRQGAELSQGEQLRFSIARVCLNQRPVMLFDEPTSHLDADHAERVRAWITSTPRTSTVIIATHDDQLASQCDRVIYISEREGQSLITEEVQARAPHRDSAQDQAQDHPELSHEINHEINHEVSHEINHEVSHKTRCAQGHHSQGVSALDRMRAQLNRWRFAARHLTARWRLYLLLGVAAWITLAAPLAARRVLEGARAELDQRAQETPLIIGAEQSPLDLFFGALYFSATPREPLEMCQFEQLGERSLAPLAPLLISGSARGLPLVATDSVYLEHRALHVTRGRLPLLVGEIALSESLARAVELPVGAKIYTDLTDLYQLSAPSPIELEVVGHLRGTQRADRAVLFTTLATGWAALGLSHDHAARRGAVGADEVLAQRVTSERYHLHQDPGSLPLSAVLAFPDTPRAQSITKMRASALGEVSVIDPVALSRDTLKFSEELERMLRPLLMLLVILSGSLTLTIIAQRHAERAHERRALEAIGASWTLRAGLAAREYTLWSSVIGVALWITLKVIDLTLTPDDLWRAVSSLTSAGS